MEEEEAAEWCDAVDNGIHGDGGGGGRDPRSPPSPPPRRRPLVKGVGAAHGALPLLPAARAVLFVDSDGGGGDP